LLRNAVAETGLGEVSEVMDFLGAVAAKVEPDPGRRSRGGPGWTTSVQQRPAVMHACTVSMFLLVTIDVPVFTSTGLRLYFA